jgi:O-antigen/teichoic acid export membrane protein
MSRALVRIGLNSLYQFIAKLINAFTALAIITIVLRGSGGEELVGAYTTILGYIGMYFIFVDAGLNSITVKQIIAAPSQKTDILSNLLNLRLILALLATIISTILVTFLEGPGYTDAVKASVGIVSLSLFTQALLSTLNAYAQSIQNYQILLPINLLNSLTQLSLLLLFSHDLNLLNLLFTYVAGAILTLFTIFIYLYTNLKLAIFKIKIPQTLQLLRESAPITLSMLTNLIYFRIDALIMPAFRGLEEIGRYNIAYRIFENILTLPTYATNSAYPVLLQHNHHSKQKYQKSLFRLILTYIAISIFITLITHILGPYVIALVVGRPSPEITNYLIILSYGTTFFFTSSALMTALIIAEKQKWLFYIYLTSMILSILLNLYLIPIYGAIAAAYLTVALESFVCIMALYVLYIDPKLHHLYRRRLTR